MDQLSINIQIQGIEIVEKRLVPAIIQQDQVFEFHIKAQLLPDASKNIVVVFTKVAICKHGDTNEIAVFVVACGFTVEDMGEKFKADDNGDLLIPKEFDELFRSIAISTTRGVVFSELRGTQLHKAIMPIIVPKDMLPDTEAILGQPSNK